MTGLHQDRGAAARDIARGGLDLPMVGGYVVIEPEPPVLGSPVVLLIIAAAVVAALVWE